MSFSPLRQCLTLRVLFILHLQNLTHNKDSMYIYWLSHEAKRQFNFNSVQFQSRCPPPLQVQVQDACLTFVLVGTFATIVTTLAPYVDRWIQKVTSSMVKLWGVEVKRKKPSTQVRPLYFQTGQCTHGGVTEKGEQSNLQPV